MESGVVKTNTDFIRDPIAHRKRLFIPELHDIHPGSYRTLARIISSLPPTVTQSLTLLIVPCWRNTEVIDPGTPLLGLIHSLPGEKVLHGYSHDRPDTIWNRLWFGTEHHGEFGKLAVRDARARLILGLSTFERAGLPQPRLFCAPRWLQSRATTEALFELGFSGFMDRRGLGTRNGARHAIPAVGFDTGSRRGRKIFHLLTTRLYIDFLMKTGRPFRLALHPSDTEDTRIARFLTVLFARLERDGWQPATVDEIITL